MEDMKKRCWAEIDLGAVRTNYLRICEQLPAGCGFLGVVKANGYGHGAIPVARELEKLGCTYFAVASLDEAIHLRQGGITAPVLILGWTPPEYISELKQYSLTQAVGDRETALRLSEASQNSCQPLRVHIKLETGMGRTGFQWDRQEDREALLCLLCSEHFDPEGIFTHFAVSDDPSDPFTDQQFKRFLQQVAEIENASGHRFTYRHCANSGAVVNYPQYACDLVRPGIALYGLHPDGREYPQLQPVMTLKTRISMVTEHRKGDSISYGRTFVLDRDRRIAVATIGYADGLRRGLSGRTHMLLRGRKVPQIGRICMDMCMLDVTELPECQPGDEVTVFGGEGPSVNELARICDTISYELLCGISERVPRVLIGE